MVHARWDMGMGMMGMGMVHASWDMTWVRFLVPGQLSAASIGALLALRAWQVRWDAFQLLPS